MHLIRLSTNSNQTSIGQVDRKAFWILSSKIYRTVPKTHLTFKHTRYLQSDELAELRDYHKDKDIIISVAASISVIGSAAIIWHILRSHKGFSSSTYHRLVFGLCVGDLMSSLGYAVNSTAAPIIIVGTMVTMYRTVRKIERMAVDTPWLAASMLQRFQNF